MNSTVESAVVTGQRIPARAWHTLFITSVSMFLVAMDVTIVSVALPGIATSFSTARDPTKRPAPGWRMPMEHQLCALHLR